jgi:DNA-binding ferritin-like protein (Dps family)
LYAALTPEERQKYLPPLFFYFDNEMQNARQYKREIKQLPEQHKAAYKYAQSLIRKHPYLDTHVLHHIDQLDLSLVAD